MHLKLITSPGKPNQLIDVVEAVLNVDELVCFSFTALVDIQNLTYMPPVPNFFDE